MIRAGFLTTAARVLALIVGRATGTTGIGAQWALSTTVPATATVTLTRVTFRCNQTGNNLYFFTFDTGTSQIAAVDGPYPSVNGANDYAVSLPIVAGQRLGVYAVTNGIAFSYVTTGGSGFSYLNGAAMPVVGAGPPGGLSSLASPNSLHLAGYA